jgi:hypothetical protein
VNNIRNYYNIIKWLTENEVIPEEEPTEEIVGAPELVAATEKQGIL